MQVELKQFSRHWSQYIVLQVGKPVTNLSIQFQPILIVSVVCVFKTKIPKYRYEQRSVNIENKNSKPKSDAFNTSQLLPQLATQYLELKLNFYGELLLNS